MKYIKYKKAQLGNNNYIVKSGDNLSTIAKKHNVSINDIISTNNIKNPDVLSLNQSLVIPKPKVNSVIKKPGYLIKQGDTLYDIAKNNNIGVNELKKANNLTSDTILAGKYLNIPKGLNEQVKDQNKKATQTFKMSNTPIDNRKVVLDYHKNSEDNFSIIDKKTNTLEIYKKGKLYKTINVGLGKNKSDVVTGLGGVKNYNTGAGVYSIASPEEYKYLIEDKHNQKLYGNNITGYKNERGVVQGSFLHQVPEGNEERNKKLQDSNPNNNRFSQGCVNCKKKDYEDYIKNLTPGNKLYILPEEDDNFFEVKNNKINFTTNKNKDIRGYNYTYDDKGNYLSSKVRRDTYQPFKTSKKLSSHILDNRNTQKQFNILSNQKKQLMEDLQLDSDTYDVLANQLMGHIKQETGSGLLKDFGERIINNVMDVIPIGHHTAENSSRGDLQIRYNQIPKNILKKYNVNSPDDLDDIEKAIPIGMFLKKDGLQQVVAKRNKLNNLTRENALDFVPYQYNQAKLLQDPNTNPQKNKYVRNVLNYAKNQLGGQNLPLVKAESKEVFQAPNGNIMKVNNNAPSHDDGILINGNKTSSASYNEGGVIIPANSVLSATHENRDSGDKSYTEADEAIKIKPKELDDYAKMLGFSKINNKKSVSPSKGFELLRNAKIKQADKYLKASDNNDPFIDKYSEASAKANLSLANTLPSDEDIYNLMFDVQETKKNYLNVRKAQLGGAINTGLNIKENGYTYKRKK